MGYSINIPRARGWYKRPGTIIGINPILTPRGLIYSVPFKDNANAEFLKGVKATNASVPTLTATRFGTGMALNGEVAHAINWPSTSSPFSTELLTYWKAAASGFPDIGGMTDTGTQTATASPAYFTSTTGTNGGLISSFGAGTIAGAAIGANTLQHFVATYNGTTLTLYQNGKSQGTPITHAAPYSGTSFLTYGASNLNNGVTPTCTFLLANLATVAWTAAEVLARYLNPYGYFVYEEDLAVMATAASAFVPYDPWPQWAPVLAQ